MAFYKDKGKGTWYIDDHLRGPDGKDIHLKKRGYRTKKEAEEDYYRQKRLLLEKLGDKTTSPDDFSGLMDGYFAAESGRVRFHTLDNELVISGKYIAPSFSHRRICDATEPDCLSKWRAGIGALGVKSDRKSLIVRTLLGMVSHGFDQGKVSAVSFRMAKAILQPFGNDSLDVPAQRRALTPEEYHRFISTFKADDKYRVLFEAFFFLGCRCSELEGLQWGDIDREKRTIYIHKQIQYYRFKKESVITPPKTRSSIRYLRLSPFIYSEIMSLEEGYGGKPDRFLFFGDTAITKNPIVSQIAKHCRLAGIPRFAPHEIRHTCASWLVGNCRDMSDLIVVQRWLGHASLKETLDTYSHYLKGSGAQVTSVLGEIQSFPQSSPKVPQGK